MSVLPKARRSDGLPEGGQSRSVVEVDVSDLDKIEEESFSDLLSSLMVALTIAGVRLLLGRDVVCCFRGV